MIQVNDPAGQNSIFQDVTEQELKNTFGGSQNVASDGSSWFSAIAMALSSAASAQDDKIKIRSNLRATTYE
jgi:hypothetical protein